MRFEKWHGLGNDFVVVIDAEQSNDALERLASRLCDRNRGVGADGVLICRSEPRSMVVANADGSRPEMCGNGLRCVVAAFARRAGAASGETVVVTDAGPLNATWERRSDDIWDVGAELGRVSFDPGAAGVDLAADGSPVGLEAAGVGTGFIASIGNPHWVFLDVDPGTRVAEVGPRLERDPRFGARTNVEFVRRIGPLQYRVDVWERGCGITQACGTGAAAVSATLVALGREAAGATVEIALPGGTLACAVSAEHAVRVTGPAERVFAGETASLLGHT